MLKFWKKKENLENLEKQLDNPQAISVRGNTFRRYLRRAVTVILLPLLCGHLYLLFIREASVEANQIQHAADSLARQQAIVVEQLFTRIKLRLSATAAAPLTLAAVFSQDPADTALVEKSTMDYFPGITSLRLFTLNELGTSGLEGSNLGLRNHIEIDLLRRTGEGEQTPPESYQFEGRWLTSIAELIQHPRAVSKRAVLLASFDNKIIDDALAAMDTDQGRSALVQTYKSGNFTRADEIAFAGASAIKSYESSATLNGGNWSLVFIPSAAMLNQLAINSVPLIAVIAITLIAILAAFMALLLLFEKFLASEVARIIIAADKKNPLEVQQPQLLPIAKQLRLATLRQVTKVGAKGKRKKMTRREGEAGFSDPMFQKTNMIDGEGDEEDLKTADVESEVTDPTAFPAHIFRAYDIRGLVATELNDSMVTSIGRALGTLAGTLEQQAFIVGCDGRESSPLMKNVLVRALLDSGRDVIDIGMVPTPLMYFATQTLSTKSGVMITGSHNPAEYNGIKITLDGRPLAGEKLIMLREQVIEGKFSEGAGRLVKQDVSNDYLDAIVSDMAIASPLKIVVDAGNGVAGEIGPRVLEELGCEVIPLYCDIDGSFPNHHPDPSVDANLADLKAMVTSEQADFGVAFDGDGDRLAVVTAEGVIVRTDKLLMLYAQDVVSRNPGADVIFDVKCSRHLAQLVSRYGGRPILWKTGHAFIREKLLETGALLAGEFSGHIFFGERWFGFDDGMYAAARLAEIISGSGSDLTTLLSDFPETESTPEIRIPVPENQKFEIMERLVEEADFSPGKVNNLDGIRVDYNDGWGLVRASNTEPALVLRFEGQDTDALERIMTQFRDQLNGVEPNLGPAF
jgi:phosphomannomutase/phosphoglucomutase